MRNYFKRVQALLDIIHKYDELSYASNIKNKYYSSEYLKYVPLIDRWCDKNMPVLDWGALYGHVSILFEELGFEVTPFCVSPSPGSRAALTSQFQAKFFESEERSLLPFKDESFGTVISSGVFEHVYEMKGSQEESLKEIHRIIRKNGYFILWKLPNVSSLNEIKSDLIGRWSHHFRFTANGITALLTAHGFKVVLIEREGLLPASFTAFFRRVGIKWNFQDYFANLPLLKVFANDFIVVAQKMS